MLLAAAQRCGAEGAPRFPEVPFPSNEVFIENHVPIKMRDGVTLYADIYRPVGDGRYPVIVGRTPYDVERLSTPMYEYPDAYVVPLLFARRGFVFVLQDVRGRYESEGQWQPFRNDIRGGYDTIEWAARQSWSNGKVGMHGMSYEGTVQWRAAMSAPPHLVTIVPSVASTSPYHDWVTSNGAWRLTFNLNWGAIRMESRVTQSMGPNVEAGGPESLSVQNIQWSLPLLDMQRRLGRNGQLFREWIAHPNYDEYWKAVDAEEVFDQIGIPVLNFGGWFDLFRQGTLRGYTGMRARGKTAEARQGSRLVMGPWGHYPSRQVGLVDFGETAFVDQNALALEWFDYWLKGIDNGVGKGAPVRLFVMGANEWRDEDAFPPSRAQLRKLYFHSDGPANSSRGTGRLSWSPPPSQAAVDQYVYDPSKPVMTSDAGLDQRPLERRNDVLVYTSEFLDRDIEVIGPIQVGLYASSDAPDTDFVARLVDVYPDGRAIYIAEGILRARYRESTSHPKWLEPGVVYPLKIDLAGTANAFLKGHRIRVDITSSEFPAFDRNLNTAEPFGVSAKVVRANQSVHHSAQYPSYILLPLMPPKAVHADK